MDGEIGHDTRTKQQFNKDAIVPATFLSHGTLGVRDIDKTRQFYEEFFGFECVQHNNIAFCFRLNTHNRVVCVQTRRPLEMDMMTHWGLDVASEEEVDRAHANAEKYKDEYGIQKIMPPANQHGVYSFFMQDLDNNWWEVQHPPQPDHTDWYLKRGEHPNEAP